MASEAAERLELGQACPKCHFNDWYRENLNSTLKEQWFICNVCETKSMQKMPNIARGVKKIEIDGTVYNFPAQWSDNPEDNALHIMTLAMVMLNNPLVNKVLEAYGTKVQDIDGNVFFPREDMFEGDS